MKKYLATIIIVFAASLFASSQSEYQIHAAMEFFRISQLDNGEWKSVITDNDIEGSPYLEDEFKNGIIFTASKMQFVDIPLRYNIFNDNLEFKTPEEKIQELAAPEIVEKAVFGDIQMVYIPYSDLKKIKRGFFVVVEEGNASLFEKPVITYVKPTKPGAYQEAESAKFIRKSDAYYIRIGKEQAKKVGNKKEVVEIFPDHQSEISTFIKKNKIKTNNQESLLKLVKYYNSI